jgi:SAM-dependent methyltransferase
VDDRKELVRRGYDAVSQRYDETYGAETKYQPWLAALVATLPPGSTVVDLGCGSGVPVARAFAAAGHRVVGVDFSEGQLGRARSLVPGARFVRADLAGVSFPPASLDAVVAFYSIIHVPLDEQPALLGRIGSWLRPGGVFAATMGHTAWTGTDDDWLGAPMWWSHADADTNRSWLAGAGLVVEREEYLPEGDGGVVLFEARRPS